MLLEVYIKRLKIKVDGWMTAADLSVISWPGIIFFLLYSVPCFWIRLCHEKNDSSSSKDGTVYFVNPILKFI